MEGFRTCRICRKQGHFTVRYALRQYAHGRCFLERYGVLGLGQLDLDELMAFPVGIAAEFGLVGQLLELVKQGR